MKRPSRPIGLRRRLLSLALVGIVPFAFLAAVGLIAFFYKQQDVIKQRSLETTRSAATSIELELRRSIDLANALATSPVLLHGQLSDFQGLINRILPLMPGWASFTLSGPDSTEIFRVGAISEDAEGLS